jgi:hypothetical protein
MMGREKRAGAIAVKIRNFPVSWFCGAAICLFSLFYKVIRIDKVIRIAYLTWDQDQKKQAKCQGHVFEKSLNSIPS